MKQKRALLLREQLFHSYMPLMILSIILVSLLLILSFVFVIANNTLGLRQETNRQVLRNVDEYLENLTTLVNYPYLDRELMSILQKDYTGESAGLERTWDATTVRDKLAQHVYHTRTDINSALIIPEHLDMVYAAYRGSFWSADNYRESEWYKLLKEAEGEIVLLGLYYNELTPYIRENFGIGRCIKDPRTGEILAVMILNTIPERLISLWSDTDTDGNDLTVAVDAQGRIYHANDPDTNEEDLQSICARLSASGDSTSGLIRISHHLYWFMRTQGSEHGWTVLSFMPIHAMLGTVFLFLALLLLVILVTWTLLKRSSQAVAVRITQPLDDLHARMDQVAQGDMSVRVPEGEDEIGILGHHFNHMSDQLQELIEQIHTEERERRNTELLALQSQINPHFLYNTLSSIRVMAQMQGARRVADILEELIQFLRACTKSVEETIPLKQEIEMSRHYLEIMNFRYLGHIQYRIHVPEDLENVMVLRFILQPFLENAIVHGIDLSQGGHILLKAEKDHHDLLLTIADNGRGMTEEQCAALLDGTWEQKGALNVGANNVIRRIQIKYGVDNGVTVKSKIDHYTVIQIRLPQMIAEM